MRVDTPSSPPEDGTHPCRLTAGSKASTAVPNANTERAHRSDLAIFAAWCAERAVASLPASAEIVAAFVDAMAHICCGQDYVAESRSGCAGHEDPPFLRNIISVDYNAPRKAISPLFSFHGRTGPGSAASHSAIAFAFISRSISA